MARRVPVLRHHDVGKALGEPVDDRHDLIAVLHREAAARQEAILHVDDEQCRRIVDLDRGRRPERPRGDRGYGQAAQRGECLSSVHHDGPSLFLG